MSSATEKLLKLDDISSKRPRHEVTLETLSSDLNPSLFAKRKFSAYIHIPFCKHRCGYCDFNTYTNTNFGVGASVGDYVDSLCLEYDFAVENLENSGVEVDEIDTVFFGGGTPTFLEASELSRALEELSKRIPLSKNVEVTTEVNPETVDENYISHLAENGFTRLSFGAQSGVDKVLKILDRQHDKEKIAPLIQCAKDKGLQTSVDLIYATPGESVLDWEESINYALKLDTDHISAYALLIHEGTKLGQDLKRGKIPAVDSDDEAVKYEIIDNILAENGYRWYEISNWAKNDKVCRHNLAYWNSHNWWGFGCGAHSYVNATRWSNLKHPRVYANRLANNQSPVYSKEILTEDTIYEEKLMLEIRLREGIDLENSCFYFADEQIEALKSAQYILEEEYAKGKLVLSLKGRLMADTVTQILWDSFSIRNI